MLVNYSAELYIIKNGEVLLLEEKGMKRKKKSTSYLLKILLIICMVCSIFSSIGLINQKNIFGIESNLINVARNDEVKVYTNPKVENSNVIVDGDTRYQYVTQSARNYIDLSFGKDNKVDKNGYNYMEGSYIIVDLGASYLIDSLKIYDFEREGGMIRDYIYDVSFSNDSDFDIDLLYNVNWQKIGEKSAETGKYVTDIKPTTKMMARYIKLDNLKCKGATGFVMTELEAYASETVDIEALKKDSIEQLKAYKQNIDMNSNEKATVSSIISDYTNRISGSDTKEDILKFLNEGYKKIDDILVFAEYREEKRNEILNYKSEEGLFSSEDKEKQLKELDKAIKNISNATNLQEVDAIVKKYKDMVDLLEILVVYEIIPSPHDILYGGKYNKYYKDINVVCVDGTIDEVTFDYINEIFGNKNVTISTKPKASKTNLYLTSDDKDDDVEKWIRSKYTDKIDDTILSKNESHIIIADENGISIIGNDDEGLFRGLTTIKFIKSQIESNSKGYRDFVIKDYADMPFRGLIEGYYGKPWSWSEKAELLKFGSDFKMNKLVFAPKNDPYHTTKWKELYPDKSENPENNIQNIEIAASTARKYKADLVWTAHCFGYTNLANAGENGIRYKKGDENIEGSDINLLKAKFQQMYDVGVRTFGLLLDDCDYGPRTLNTPYEGIYNNKEALTEEVLAETTAIVNIMAEWCEEKGDCYDLIFCPAGYVTGWMENGFERYFKQAYPYQEISYYDINFNDNVQIITTGREVFSDTDQNVADLFKTAGVNAQTGYEEGDKRRSPLMWTNYPTVDNNSVLDFGPISNFKTDLNPSDLSGMMSNPFQWAQFNKTVIPMVTQYTWNLKDYDANKVYRDSMKYVMDTRELADAMLIFTNHNNKRGDEGEGTEELNNAIKAFKSEITQSNAEAVLVEINKILNACDVLLDRECYSNLEMYEQLNLYVKSLRDLAETIQKYMIIFEQGSNVYKELNEADNLFKRHTSYVLKDIPQSNGSLKDMYTETGTRTLKPFAQWLKSNKDTIAKIANPHAEEELATRKILNNYLEEQIKLLPGNYYYDASKKIINILEEKKIELEETLYSNLPSLDELKLEVVKIQELYENSKPIKKEINLISNGKKVTAGNLENESWNKVESIIDGDPETTCSTVMGDPDNPAYVQIDLGENRSLQEIWIVCYVGGRWYKYDIHTSIDGKNFDLLENKNDTVNETENGNWFNADGINARYIRIVGNSNSVNKYFHVGEVKVYAKDVNKTELADVINMYKNLSESDYTTESFASFKVALDAAIEVYGKEDATQVEVNEAVETLIAAVKALEEKNESANKTALKIALDLANAITDKDLENVVPVVVNEFKQARDEANKVYNNASATQDKVNKAFDRLSSIMQKLEFFKGDKTALKAFIDKVSGLEAAKYTEATWVPFNDALTAATSVYEDENAMQEEVNNAYNELVTAFLKLRLIPDKSLLEDLINQANGLNSANYTKVTFDGLTKALNEAKAVFANPNATQTEVDNAKDVLTKAINGLQANMLVNNSTVSVKTGDERIAEMLAGVALLSVAGVVMLRRKEN